MAWADVIQARPAQPAVLGADLAPYPYLSGYGLMQRITRLASPLPSQVSALGFRNRKVTDVLLTTQRLSKPTDILLRVLGLQATTLARYWAPETWCPVQTGDLFLRQARPLRRCPDCAQHGYHCAVFQLPSITHCPWHGAPLQHQCPQCDRPLHARFNDKGQLGVCPCGHDPFDPVLATVGMWEFPSEAAHAWLENCLAWSHRQRHRRWLCVPRACSDWDRGFAVLARPPSRLAGPSPSPSMEDAEVFCGPGADPPPRQFWGWGLWGGERPLSLAPLPATMYPRLCEATKRVVEQLPRDTRTPFELVQPHALQADATLRENIATRADCFIAPHRPTQGQATWLNVSVVDAGLAAFCGEALDQVTHHLGERPEFAARSLQAERSNAMDAIEGRRHLAGALESMLTRAYRQGLARSLRSKLGQVSLPPLRRSYPLMEFKGRRGQLRSVRVHWGGADLCRDLTALTSSATGALDKPARQERLKPRDGLQRGIAAIGLECGPPVL